MVENLLICIPSKNWNTKQAFKINQINNQSGGFDGRDDRIDHQIHLQTTQDNCRLRRRSQRIDPKDIADHVAILPRNSPKSRIDPYMDANSKGTELMRDLLQITKDKS